MKNHRLYKSYLTMNMFINLLRFDIELLIITNYI